jgi:hypothetical protein
MLPEQEQILIDYLDNQLQGQERQQAEQFLQQDLAAAQELEHLLFSVELIREAAVLEQVMAVRTEQQGKAKVISIQKNEGGAVVRSFSRTFLRVAVAVLLFAGAGSVYKYSTTNASSVYDQGFSPFELNTSRGNNNDGKLEQAYRNKNWNEVENIASLEKEKNNKTRFLAGMAAMELKNYNKAIEFFNEIILANQNSTNPVFQDEAEYYLAMADLGANKPAAGAAILRKIRADKEHLFYKKASAISALDLKLLELKK